MAQLDETAVQNWLDAYVQAWLTYDPAAIGALFSDDAVYHYDPFSDPVRGRDAIVASWAEGDRRDPPGTYSAHYAPIVVSGDTAVSNGRSCYFEADGVTPKDEFDNLFVMRFDDTGRCVEFHEWYMRVPRG